MRKALFLDRDGTIIHDPGYLSKIEQIQFFDGVLEKISFIRKMGFMVFIITNQSGVARGYFSEHDLRIIHDELLFRMENAGAKVDALRYCPHGPSDGCGCRKPNPKMVLDLASDFDVDLKKSFFIGDKVQDVITGKNAGCKTALITHGKPLKDIKDTSDVLIGLVEPDFAADTPEAALNWVINDK